LISKNLSTRRDKMDIKIDDKAVNLIKKQNFEDVYIYVEGCSG